MNKGAIQRFAIWARNELIAQVSQRAYQYGITKEGCGEANAVTVGGRALTADEQKQRKELVDQIRSKGYAQVMEEVAYTWFNRFIALRFMEVNNYLPSHIRVFSDSTGAFKPEILSDVLHLDLPGLNREKVAEYIESNDTEGLYRYLLLTQCNALNEALPRMFEEMGGYTELLLPNNILKQDSVLGHMVADIPEEDWQDAVQIIGWLYQYYNTELNAVVYDGNMSKSRIPKELLPAATTIYTPDWAIRYMVENSLGRIYVDKRKNEGIYADGRGLDEMTWHEAETERIATEKLIADKMGWKYYLPEAEQTQEVRKQLDEIQAEFANLDVKDIKVIDPCMGSGHILVYAFDVLMQIYEASGYSQRDAAQSILENNLFGLDIDDRAAQLAYFAVMMKARQYDRRIFSRGIQPHVYAIVESNGLDSSSVEYFTNNDLQLKKDFGTLMDELRDAKDYGSILNISQVDFASLYARVEEVRADISMFRESVLNSFLPLIQVAEVMAQKYDVVVTNPPYMGSSGMNARLAQYVKDHFPNTKADLFACFIERGNQMAVKHGYNCMVTMQSWMFLSSFEKMREKVLQTKTITNLMHMENMVMGIAFGTAVTVFRNNAIKGYKGTYNQIKLQDIENGEPKTFPVPENRFAQTSTDNFSKIPGSPVAYWASSADFKCFEEGKYVSHVATPASGTSTGDNDSFLRLWHEVIFGNINLFAKNGELPAGRWFPCNKGGSYRRWAGGSEYVIDWENDGQRVKACPKAFLRNVNSAFKSGLTWSKLGSGTFSIRYFRDGYICESIGCSLFQRTENILNCLGLLNSVVAEKLLAIINPSMGRQPGYIGAVPYLVKGDNEIAIQTLAKTNIDISSTDWDSYETSWDFKRNPLV